MNDAWSLHGRATLCLATQTGTGIVSHWLPFPQILLIVIGVLVVGLLLVAGAQWFFRHKLFVMKPHEVALQELEIAAHRARGNASLNHHEAVLEILHHYVRAKFRLMGPGMEAEALLKTLAQSEGPLTRGQRLLLRDILDAPKQGLPGTLEGIAEISRKGVRFVWATVAAPSAKSSRQSMAVGTKNAA